jgi:hypothetical protein
MLKKYFLDLIILMLIFFQKQQTIFGSKTIGIILANALQVILFYPQGQKQWIYQWREYQIIGLRLCRVILAVGKMRFFQNKHPKILAINIQ